MFVSDTHQSFTMITHRELDERRAELTGLRELFGTATDELFEKPLLRSKIEARAAELLRMEQGSLRSATEAETVTLSGEFRGVLPDSGRFDFIPDGQPLMSGVLAEAVTEAEAEVMVPHHGHRCRATLSMTRYSTLGRLSRPTYELLRLERAI